MRTHKIVSIVGARPQFIKAATVSRALRDAGNVPADEAVIAEVLVHTGQHYDYDMSAVFFQELGLPEPSYSLGIGSGAHGWQTGLMLIGIEEVLLAERPDWVLVYGDTNSTLAGVLAAAKLRLPVAHVEAGLRSFNRAMPEEVNRVLADHSSDMLLCPTETAVTNLAQEGIVRGVHLVGDVMYDAVLFHAGLADQRAQVLDRLGLTARGYALATVHRPHNTDNPSSLRAIVAALAEIAQEAPVVFPVHPRTRKAFGMLGLRIPPEVLAVDPVGYLDMLALEKSARLILTDSGGVQKEAYFFAVPCLTLRQETEWVETVGAGWNRLVNVDPEAILQAAREFHPQGSPPPFFGDGHAADKIVALLKE